MLPDLERVRARRRRYVLLVLGVSLLLVVAAALAPEGFGWFGGSEPGSSGRERVVVDLPVLFQYLLVAIATVALATFVAARASVMKEYRAPERRPMWPMVISAILFLLLLAFSRELREFLGDLPGPPDGSSDAAERAPGSEGRPDTRATLLGWILTAALAIVFARLLIGGYILFHRDAAARRGSTEQEMLLEEIDAGLDDLNRIADPRAAVIACYARLQAFAGRAGVERRASDTPVELLERMLERYESAGPGARRLTDLFERAKFSTARIDESARRDALAALRDVRDRIGAPA